MLSRDGEEFILVQVNQSHPPYDLHGHLSHGIGLSHSLSWVVVLNPYQRICYGNSVGKALV